MRDYHTRKVKSNDLFCFLFYYLFAFANLLLSLLAFFSASLLEDGGERREKEREREN
jgi:hypothetical protein